MINITAAAKAAEHVLLMGFDVDGTLTDGGLYFGAQGEALKRFSVFDGQGLRLLMQAGVEVTWITARHSEIVAKRAADLGIRQVIQHCNNKLDAFDQMRQHRGLDWNQCGFFGDDWPDFQLLKKVHLACTTNTAPLALQQQAVWVNTRPAGNGAARELCDFILAHKPHFTNPMESQ